MKTTFKRLPLCAALALFFSAPLAFGQTITTSSTPDAVLQRMEQMSAELQQLRAEVLQLKAAQNKTDATATQANAAAVQAQAEVQTAVATLSGGGLKLGGLGGIGGSSTVLTGYGEINYNRYPKNPSATQADARRIVLGVQHRFNDQTKFVGEFEWEHAVTSASDKGETAIEQAYIEHQLTPALAVRGGLFLVPAGLLNENHEPSAYYGVERNFVETSIIPSTWREGGAMLIGTTDQGITWKAGLTTGFDLTKWDSNSGEGKASPLRSIHQELQLAKARSLSVLGAVDWRGVPGLLLGGSIFSGEAGHGSLVNTLGMAVDAKPRVTIWDLHARWTPGKWDLAAVYARGTISDTAKLNTNFAADPTPIPASFDGGYVQAAYNVWRSGDYKLTPFARYERFATAKSYAAFPTGLGRASDPYERVATVGASFQLAPGVVIKSDYQTFAVNKLNNRFNLGLGWSF